MLNASKKFEKRQLYLYIKKIYFPFLYQSKVLICQYTDTNEPLCSEKPSVAIILRLSEKLPQDDRTIMGLRQLLIFLFFQCGEGLYTSESILTYRYGLRADRVDVSMKFNKDNSEIETTYNLVTA